MLTLATEGVGDGLACTAQGVLGRAEDALALLLSIVAAAADGVGCLLAGRLGLLRLDGAGDALVGTGCLVLDRVGGGLLRLRGDGVRHLGAATLLVQRQKGSWMWRPRTRDPCGRDQTCLRDLFGWFGLCLEICLFIEYEWIEFVIVLQQSGSLLYAARGSCRGHKQIQGPVPHVTNNDVLEGQAGSFREQSKPGSKWLVGLV